MVFFYSFLVLAACGLGEAIPQGPPGGGGPPGGSSYGGGQPGGGAPTGFGGGPSPGSVQGNPNFSPPSGQWRGQGQTAGSPPYTWIFDYPLPVPKVAVPEFSETLDNRTINFYSVTIDSFTQQVYPNLPATKLIGYQAQVPGPTFMVERYDETVIRYLNHGDDEASVHLHGSYTHAPWDGWADDTLQVGQWKDYYYPNSEPARSIWYHDHAESITATNAYFGQAGLYIIYDPAEDKLGLPTGDYDVGLALTDKIYNSDGQLVSPANEDENFFGDIIHVNEQPWPYFEVEPRKYRLRFYDMSLSRAYQLYFQTASGNAQSFQMIASDSGLYGGPVDAGDFIISPGERYEVVIDFSSFSGQNVTLMNALQIPEINEFANTDKVMQFVVGSKVTDSSNNGPVPEVLNPDIMWPADVQTVSHVFNFQQGGSADWTINGVSFNDKNNRILAKPPQGTVERWQLVHAGGPAIHPVHIHLVNMQVVSRTGGSRGVEPYEAAGLKDVVLLEPGETVDVLAYYGPWNGVYMFHCHNLVHEDNLMLDAFNVSMLIEKGYSTEDTSFANPMDPRFLPQEYSASAFTEDDERAAVSSLAALNAYPNPTPIMEAQAAYYSSLGGYPTTVPDATMASPTSTGHVGDYVWQGMGGTTSSTAQASQTPAPKARRWTA